MTRRVLVGILTVTVLVLLLLEIPLGLFYAQRELERLTGDVERDAAVISTIYEDDLEADVSVDPRPATLYAQRTGARVVVTDARGIAKIDTEGVVPRDFSTRPEIASAMKGTLASGKRRSETLGADLVFVAIPVASSGTVHGTLRLTLPTSEIDSRIHRYWLGLVGVAGIVLAIMTMVGWAIARSVTRPIRNLTAVASRFADGDLTLPDELVTSTKDPEELQVLTRTLATMAERLSKMLEEQRSFVADASHQLRTPLTALRLRLENLQAQLPQADTPAIDSAIDEADRLSGLVSDLLQLARADQPRPREIIDLVPIAEQRIDTWTAVAETQGVTLEIDVSTASALVQAVPGAVEQILDNALDNSLKVAPANSAITVRVSSEPQAFVLQVVDRGPGLSDEDKSRAVRRFWRASPSGSGTGLGLAIADGLARASGGELRLSDTEGGGLTLTLRLDSAP